MTEDEFDMNASLRENFLGEKSRKDIDFEKLDQIIDQLMPKSFKRKMARMILDVCKASDGYFSADDVANRLISHVENGRYAGYGNLTRWAFSEIGPVKCS